jgi:hypothetical protein
MIGEIKTKKNRTAPQKKLPREYILKKYILGLLSSIPRVLQYFPFIWFL